MEYVAVLVHRVGQCTQLSLFMAWHSFQECSVKVVMKGMLYKSNAESI